MTSRPPDSPRTFAEWQIDGRVSGQRERKESGERESVRPEALQRFGEVELPSPITALRAKRLQAAEREIDAAAPAKLRTDLEDWDRICKERAKAALEDSVYAAGSGRELGRLARLKGAKSIEDWRTIDQRVVPFHLPFRVPDWLSEIMLRHVVRHWGVRALREHIAYCQSLLGESDDAPVRRAM